MALAKLDLSAPAGTPVVAIGDGSGATALAQVASAADQLRRGRRPAGG